MNEQIATQEMFGVPVDFKVTSDYDATTITQRVEFVAPAMVFGADGVLRVWAPPRIEAPVSDRELRAMRLLGLIK